jgi:hypothetical protein
MTQLANANLLDESVANSGSLKSRRLNNTAITASNPNPTAKRPNPIPNPTPTTTLKKVDMNEEEEEDFESDYRADDYINYNNNLSKMQEKPNDDKKILGMKPALFWTLFVGAAAVGAYFGYKYIKKKGMIGGTNAVPNAVPNNAVPNVTNNIT